MSDNNWRGPFHAKTVVESDAATETINNLKAKYERFEDVIDHVFWALARGVDNPQALLRLEHSQSSLYIAGLDSDVFSYLCILLTVSEDEITILDVKLILHSD